MIAFPRAVDIVSRRFRPSKRGRWRVELRFGEHRVRASVAVGGAPARAPARLPRVLAAGDSTMQGIDSFLGDRLAETATVRSAVYPGSGISGGLAWLRLAAAQAQRQRPRVAVISLGASEGFAMPTPDGTKQACCGEPWAAEYSRRVRAMMKTYVRHGRGRVLWLAVPTPRNPVGAVITGVVNRAVLHAAEGMAGVAVLRLDLLFTPNGYREFMRYRGQNVRVRQTDGLHLTAAGTAIAAEAAEKALRAAPGWLRADP